MAAHHLCLRRDLLSRSFRSAFFSLRWWKVDWFAPVLQPVPDFPFAFSQILWRTWTVWLPDFYDFICNIYHVPFPVWACLLQCQSLPEKVKVILWLHRWLPCTLYCQLCPLFATQLPEIHFPGIPDDFPCCSHFAICCPNTTVTRHGSFGEMERESPFLHSMSPLFLSASKAIIFHILEPFRGCDTENSSCIYNRCCPSCNVMTGTQKKQDKSPGKNG